MKSTEIRLIAELMKNSRRSDRELARVIGVSQPTVSRMIKNLEKEGVIKEYTMIPDFSKLGYELMSTVFIRTHEIGHEEREKVRKEIVKDVSRNVFPDLLMERGLGLGFEGMIITLHRNYTDYMKQIEYTKTRPFVNPDHVESFLVDLKGELRYRSLTLSLVAEDLVRRNENEDRKES